MCNQANTKQIEYVSRLYYFVLLLSTTYVTVHAKTSLVRTKIEINFLSPAYSYTH